MAGTDVVQQQQQWQALLDSAGEGIWGVNLEGLCTFVNRMAVRLLGYSSEEMVGSDMHALVHHHRADGSVSPLSECGIREVLRGGEPFRERLETMFRRDGSSFLAEISAQPVLVAGAISGVVVTFRDVTQIRVERRELDRAYGELDQAYRELEKRTAELDAVIESIPHGVYVARLEGGPVRLNRRAKALSGDRFPQGLRTLELALAGQSSSDVLEEQGRWLRSTAAPILLNGEIIGGVAVNTDVTQTRLQDEALRKSEKLAAVGQLASSIAHEINNPLESITNLLFLIREAGTMDDVQEYAGMAQTELARVTEITLQTLRFHRQQKKATWVDLRELVRTVMALYTGRLLVRGIRLDWAPRPVPLVLCMDGEIRQVLNNLVRNALDAMNSGGTLHLRVNRQQGRLGGSRTGPMVDGVRLTVADTGEGIPTAVSRRLFEPFQTTKETTGTGLGLWVSRGIVEKHQGTIAVCTRTVDGPTTEESTEEAGGGRHGTIFTVWLPLDGSSMAAESREG